MMLLFLGHAADAETVLLAPVQMVRVLQQRGHRATAPSTRLEDVRGLMIYVARTRSYNL